MKLSTQLKLSAGSLAVGFALAATPSFAQDAGAEEADGAFDGPTIVVTGSLIANPELERSSPVNTTNEEEIDLKIATSAEELIREVPGLVPSIGSNVNNGTNGAAFLNLRGLGSNRNLGLLDGNRIAPTDLSGRFDLNNIPLALIERVDVLTGGASTTYGADAITGVVNFITKRDFEGMEATVSYGITEQGDGDRFRADLTVGGNFDDGRGNAVLALSYMDNKPVYQGDRAFSNFSIGSFDGGAGGSTTTVPAGFSFSCGGVSPCPNDGTLFSGNQQVDPNTGAISPNYDVFNFNPFNVLQTPFERFNIYGAAHYEITDGIEVYTRGLFSKNFVSSIIAPSGSFGSNFRVNVNNPFLPDGLRDQFCANNDFDPNTAGIQTLTPAECLAADAAVDENDPNYREFRTNVRRRTVEVGPRLGEYDTTMFDYRAGIRGDITDAIQFDLYAAYGESDRRLTQDNYVLNSRFQPAILANNTTTCQTASVSGSTCVPLNIFGDVGSITPEMANFIRGTSTTRRSTSLTQVRGTVDGDLGVGSPWASETVGFAVGAEYRKYTAQQVADALAQIPGELGGAGGAAPNITGAYDVWEVFGEALLPIVQDRPFFEDLTLEAGIRYSDYSIDAPGNPSYTTTTWKVGGSWTPVSGLKFRGGFNRAVRAPNISELFSPVSTGLTNLGNDPCAGAAPVGNTNLTNICLAQGAPAFTIGNIPQPVSGQANQTSGGNLNVGPETADTWTIGAVWQPDFAPGLSFTIDYYTIKVEDAITLPTPGDAIAACFGNVTAASASDPACTLIGRNPADGGLSGDPGVTPGLFLALSNLGTLETSGIDWSINYSTDLGFAGLRLNMNGNWTDESLFQAGPTSVNRECVGFYSANCASIQPEWSINTRATLDFDDITASLLWRYISSQKYEPLQFQDELDDALSDPTGCPDPSGTDPGGCVVNPEFAGIDAASYFDLSLRWNATENFSFNFLVQNLLDRKPPIVGNDVGSTSFNSGNTYPSTYDALGRKYSVSATLSF
ncbi:MAG: TonB-dependent receptor [Sphingomonadales bacterium]|nr:MAG: TonB-dependent receptor [Sphingomonadales bacterium]